MGIINVTPDSFFEGSRANTEVEIKTKAIQMIKEGAAFIDLGAIEHPPRCKRNTAKTGVRSNRLWIKVLDSNGSKSSNLSRYVSH